MKTRLLVYPLLVVTMIAVAAEGEKVKDDSPVQSQVNALAAKLSAHEVGGIEILQMPPHLLTRTAITPEMLEKQFHYKLAIRNVRGGPHEATLVQVVTSIAVQPRNETADLRWGVIFYGVSGIRLGALYFDRTGRYGAVGDVPVSYTGDLFKWLDGNFSKCFR